MSYLVVINSGTRKDLARKNLAPKKQNPTACTFSAREHGQGTFSYIDPLFAKIGRPVGLPFTRGRSRLYWPKSFKEPLWTPEQKKFRTT